MNLPARQHIARFFEATLRIRAGEGRRTALLFTHLLLASAVFILGRTVRDTLFLSRLRDPLGVLPWMFVLYGVASAITVVLYAQVADRIARHRIIIVSTAVGIVTYLAAWVLVRAGVSWIYAVFYVWSEVVANLFIVQFWTLANDLHDARAAKRLFGTIGSARVLGVVLVGLGSGAIVKAIGTPQLIFVLVGLMAGIAGLALALAKEPRAESQARAGAQPRRHGPPPRIIAHPYVRALAAILLLAFVALTIGDFQFKAIARATFRGDDLARFFSLFYAATGTVSFLFQVFLTPRILARLGVGAGMCAMPAIFGAASAALLLVPKLAVATVMKFSDNGLQYTIHDTTLQALYVPFAPEVKARTRAFLDAVVKPLSYGAGGIVLVLFARHLTVFELSFLTVPVVIAWFAMIPVVRRRYLRTLEATISARGALALDHEFLLDSAGRGVLIRTLDEGTPRQALIALEQLAAERSTEFVRALERLASHGDATVRSAALYRLARMGGAGADPEPARRALADRVPDVRAAAAAADAALAEDESVDALVPLLADPAPDVRVASLAGLLKHGGLEGGIVGGAELGRLLASPDREDRIAATRALRHLGPSAYRPLRRLLADPDPAVRRAALKSAPGVADRRLAPILVQALSDPPTRRRAGQALVAIGAPAVDPLTAILDDANAPRAVKLVVPRLLRRIPCGETYDRLREHVSVTDSHLRLRVHAALSHLRETLRREAEPLPFVQRLVHEEIVDTYKNLSGWDLARPLYQTPLLDDVFRHRQQRAVRRIIRILELRYDPEPLRLVRDHLADPKRRANALEVLDTLLDAALRPLVMPFLDDVPVPEQLKRAAALVPAPPEPAEFMRLHCRHPNPYVVLLALDALARRSDRVGGEEGATLLAHRDPLVREGALRAVAAADPAGAPRLLAPLIADRDPTVARHAARELARLEGHPPPEDPMYSTVEKILFLKSAPVFERVSGEDLAPLARVADVEVFSPGRTIFSQGEMGDALYVIVRGAVAIHSGGEPIATLGPGEAFGEMAVLDSEPRSATAITHEETEVLRIGSEEFYEILHEQVEIAEGVIRLLSNRLREADAVIGRQRRAAAG
ncbi:MAG: cyclic nucleotide-binding domain-containing protein [Gemmatimonadetes bacterium]|nr:cyclic nucleotide-binding domain-containing protein [Gemmatimonadota bacterium]